MAESAGFEKLCADGGIRGMTVIYIREQGAYVQKKGGRIAVTQKMQVLLEFPVSNVDGIALMGNVQISSQALQFLLQQGVDISYYSFDGRYLGQTAAESSKNIFLRFSQYELYKDERRRLEFAKRIVKNKIENQIFLIKGYRWERDSKWQEDAEQIQKIKQKIDSVETTGELLGIEGMCSNIYFRAFGRMFRCEFVFPGRNRRPPKDPINVIISLGYTLLTKEICSALEAESFEPYLGFLHGIRYGRKSLALDLIEEFRQPIVDRMALKLFNKQMLSKYDFDIEGGRIILNTEGFRRFCLEYEKWMSGNSEFGEKTGYRNRIRTQIKQLKECIQKGTVYIPVNMENMDVGSKL